MSESNPPPSLTNLLFMEALWFSLIKLGITFCNLFAKDFDINLLSTFDKEIGRQFLMNLLSLSFFSISFITACFCEVLSSSVKKDVHIELEKEVLISSQKVS